MRISIGFLTYHKVGYRHIDRSKSMSMAPMMLGLLNVDLRVL